MDRIERFIAQKPLLHVQTRILLHDRYPNDDGPECDCCGSTVCRITATYPDLDLLYHRYNGTRVARWRLPIESQDEYDDVANGTEADQLVIPIRASRRQLDIIRDGRKLVLVTGGSRAGKTQVAQLWFLRQILMRGGPDSLFWIMGPDTRAAWIALTKLLWGSGTTAPVIPTSDGDPVLCRAYPDRERGRNAKSKLTKFLDGSLLDLRPLDRIDASRIRGESITAGLVEEASAVKSSENLIDAQNRVVDQGGSILMSTTPDTNDYLERVIETAQESESVAHYELSRYDNPWLAKSAVDAQVAELMKQQGKSAVDRQIHGKWVPRGDGPMWIHFDPDTHVLPWVQDHALERFIDPVTSRPFKDVTADAVQHWFPTTNPIVKGHRATNQHYIAGLDVNKRPMVLVIAKVFAREYDKPETWGMVVVDEIHLAYSETIYVAAKRFLAARDKRYEGMTIVVDSTAMHSTADFLRGTVGHKGSSMAATSLCEFGFDARPAQLTRKLKPKNPSRYESHMLIHELMQSNRLYVAGGRAPKLLTSINAQQVGPNGIPQKTSNTAADRLANPIDGLRYLTWRLWGKGLKPRVVVPGRYRKRSHTLEDMLKD